MTDKVKPFYIRITDDMTPQMVQDAFDKCVDAGATADDCVENAKKKNDGWHYFDKINRWNFFGVCDKNETNLGSSTDSFGERAQEITLDQLDEWLGLNKEVEWNGEGLPPVGVECEWIGGGENHGDWGMVVVHAYANGHAWIEKLKDGTLHTVGNPAHFRKPETPEQKSERERLEAIKEMAQTPKPCGFAIYDICEQLYDAGYRKQ